MLIFGCLFIRITNAYIRGGRIANPTERAVRPNGNPTERSVRTNGNPTERTLFFLEVEVTVEGTGIPWVLLVLGDLLHLFYHFLIEHFQRLVGIFV